MATKNTAAGAIQGISAGKELAGHLEGIAGGSGLDGVTPMSIAEVAPCDDFPAPVNPTKHLFGDFSD